VNGIKTILADTNFIICMLEGRKETYPNAVIVATAIKHGLPLLTADKALTKISGLDLILLQF
jgi:predicted nucleic acid-binding protein